MCTKLTVAAIGNIRKISSMSPRVWRIFYCGYCYNLFVLMNKAQRMIPKPFACAKGQGSVR